MDKQGKAKHAPEEAELSCEACKQASKAKALEGGWVRPPVGWWVSQDETTQEIRLLCPACFKPQLNPRVKGHLRADKKTLSAMNHRTSLGPKGSGKGAE
jgi:Zn finger protein HypA/HybF involved in hydrogenase expression